MGKLPRADYGFDAPAVPVGLGAAAAVLIALTVVVAVNTAGWWWLIPLAYGLFFGLSCASFVYTTRRGKFEVWAGLLSELRLTGRERVVDLGCGRGAVLTMLARLVPGGHAVGVDLWRSVDQSGNDPTGTLNNAAAEAATVDLVTADMRTLPLATGSVDVVVSSLAIHNIPGWSGPDEGGHRGRTCAAPGWPGRVSQPSPRASVRGPVGRPGSGRGDSTRSGLAFLVRRAVGTHQRGHRDPMTEAPPATPTPELCQEEPSPGF